MLNVTRFAKHDCNSIFISWLQQTCVKQVWTWNKQSTNMICTQLVNRLVKNCLQTCNNFFIFMCVVYFQFPDLFPCSLSHPAMPSPINSYKIYIVHWNIATQLPIPTSLILVIIASITVDPYQSLCKSSLLFCLNSAALQLLPGYQCKQNVHQLLEGAPVPNAHNKLQNIFHKLKRTLQSFCPRQSHKKGARGGGASDKGKCWVRYPGNTHQLCFFFIPLEMWHSCE